MSTLVAAAPPPANRVSQLATAAALSKYVWRSARIIGWVRGAEAGALCYASFSLPDNAIIVEIGCFLGCSTVLLAGGRKLKGSGKVFCIDPFDASGDTFSAPIYGGIRASGTESLRKRFEANITSAGLESWVEIVQGRGEELGARWRGPIDLLFLDGDHSYEGVRATYEAWWPFLKIGGVIAVHNSSPGQYHPSHDGSMRLAAEIIRPPHYSEVRRVDTTTFARKVCQL